MGILGKADQGANLIRFVVDRKDQMSEKYRLGLEPEKLGLADDDVVTSEGQSIIKFGSMMESILYWAKKVPGGWPAPDRAWFTKEGVEFQVLRAKGNGWEKVRFRFRLELIPDNPEDFVDEVTSGKPPVVNPSPLDDLRATLD